MVTARPDMPPYKESYRVVDVVDETKASFTSTEFWAYIALIVGLAIAAVQLDTFDASEFWRYATYATIGYLVSRGLAKSGSAHHTNAV